jgi:D-alanyl-lipoteichoic acid acyltransferase DltB (MBOAT superfamily)
MTLGGLWHGASLTFFVWGLFHGLGLAVERLVVGLFDRLRQPNGRLLGSPSLRPLRGGRHLARVGPWIGRLVTFNLVCIGWVFFRADSLATAGEILHRSVTAWGPAPLVTGSLVAVICLSLALQFIPSGLLGRVEEAFAGLPLPVQGAVLGAFFAATVALGPAGVAPFIYYQF